jgi:hypothetical protein
LSDREAAREKSLTVRGKAAGKWDGVAFSPTVQEYIPDEEDDDPDEPGLF